MSQPSGVAAVGRNADSSIPPLTREQLLISAAIMSALALAALDSTVVGTAMPTIIGQLGGLSEYGWVFSAYLLASTATVPLYAKLADMVGRKPVFLFGIGVFVAGSVLCGLSSSMLQLILFRTIQGIGAGAVQPMSFTIAGDIFEPRQRAKMQGLFASVWGISAIVGPALGGLITSTIGWPWVFMLNLPVGILAAALITVVLHEQFERRRHRLDVTGAVLLTGSVIALLFAVSEGASLYGWSSPQVAALLAVSVALGWLFVRVERRAAEPLVDLLYLRDPLIGPGLAVSVLSGIVLFGLTAYSPPLVQGVRGGSPLEAGATVAAMTLGWPVGAVIGGRILLRIGARPLVVGGSFLITVGAIGVALAVNAPGLWLLGSCVALIGLGMGFANSTILVIIQGSVTWNRRGVVTGLVQFSRTIGGAVGVGVLGGILTAFVGAASSAVLDPTAFGSLPPDQLAATRDLLGQGLGWIYWIIAGSSLLALIVAVRRMPVVHLGAQGGIDVRSVRAASAGLGD
jgi:EmrB/QacA subfamily drug resistance transporter